MPTLSPPLPRCVFRVALTGHRWDRFPEAAAPAIAAHLTHALSIIRDEVYRLASAESSGFASGTPELVLLSGLAAGADQLGAAAALDSSAWGVHAVLPFNREEYERDFAADPVAMKRFDTLIERACAVTVLDGRMRSGPGGERAYDAYAPLARVLVEQCDLLIAVWDGALPHGVGGTAGVVQIARQADVPILRLNPLEPRVVLVEARPDLGGGAEWTEALRGQVGRLLGPPDLSSTSSRTETNLREAYFAETLPRVRRASFFDLIGAAFHRLPGESAWLPRVFRTLLQMLRGRRNQDLLSAAEASWTAIWGGMVPEVRQAAFAHFAVHHAWADSLAATYAAAFRATYSRVFAFAWLAVLAAFTGTVAESFIEGEPGNLLAQRIHTGCVVAEALVLFVVFANVYAGRRLRLHERWLDYRALAERLRHLAILWPLARTTATIRLPALAIAGDPRSSWVAWHLRSVAREAGLISVRFDSAHVEACRCLLRDGELEQQRRFHDGARDRGRAIVHPLERLAEGLFLLALVTALANLLHWPDRLFAGVVLDASVRAALLGAVGVGLPALASGVHGFLGTSDLESIAIRSAGMGPRLRELIWRLEHLDPVDSSAIGEIGAEAARLMEGELGSWRAVTAARRLQAA